MKKDLILEVAIGSNECVEEKQEVLARMIEVNIKLFWMFYFNKYYEKAKNYLNKMFMEFLYEIDFEHQTEEQLEKYLSWIRENEDANKNNNLKNIETILEHIESLVNYRYLRLAEFEAHCFNLIEGQILTNSNYLFWDEASCLSEKEMDYIRNLIPKRGKNANKNE